ncbi:sensor histidine kinase [Marinomonas algicola]|uniref:sensor histidine kinase n=1 Tax=Marinomonas algicola TaxID=2773454 RepID=UPI00174A63A8|nr:histidine kinase [Marinomonas algicola]
MEKKSRIFDKKGFVKDTLQTVLICYVIAMVLWWSDGGEFWLSFQVSLVFGLSCLLCISCGFYFLKHYLHTAIIALIGSLIGALIGVIHLIYRIYGDISHILNVPFSDMVLRILFSFLITYIFYSTHRLNEKDKELQAQKLKTLMQEKQLTESNYKMLQSQMEPHFLFNTLANIRVLIDIEPESAKKMTDNLTDLLRASMTKAQKQIIFLKDELEIARAYLDIQKVRMGDRLAYTLTIDDRLKDEKCPPFVIQPLVENAVLHGLEPSVEGGKLSIRVLRDQTHIIVSIQNSSGEVLNTALAGSTSGPLDQESKGNGIAMNNIRQRMALLYGDEASLTLEKKVDKDKKELTSDVYLKWPLQIERSELI